MKKACFIGDNKNRIDYVFSKERIAMIKERVDLFDTIITHNNMEENKEILKDVEIAFGSWEMAILTKEEIETYFPNLKIFFYAAGSVQRFGRPLLENGIRIANAGPAMAYHVAQFALSLIILLSKGAFFASDNYKKMGWHASRDVTFTKYPGLYDKTKIGILGVGRIGTDLINYLKPFDVEILAYDPFLTEDRAKELNITKTTLEDVFKRSQVISNHIANNKHTQGILDYSLFSLMKDNAAFINTGRGAQVVEEDLARVMREKPGCYSVLDVTTVEPYPEDGVLRSVDNIKILPHIAGYAASEVNTLTDCVIRQLDDYLVNKPLDNEIKIEMLETMA